VSKTFRPYHPLQSFLLPPSPLDWLPEDHLARFIIETVGELDLSAIFARYEQEARGYPPHHPTMMVALLLYAYCVGVPSSRKIEKRTHEDIAFRVIAGNTHPDHSCISEFRRTHLAALSSLFVQVLRLCQKLGLVRLGNVALDGTKMKASASKHKAMSFERMQSDEQRLSAKVAELMKAADSIDAAEDAEHGKGRRGDELPEDLRRAKSRLEKIRALKAELEAEVRDQARARQIEAQEDHQVEVAIAEMASIEAAHHTKDRGSDDEPPMSPASATPEALPLHQVPTGKSGDPDPKAQRNFTDADSRIMKAGDGYLQGYNAQAAVDEEYQIIVAQGLSNQPPDAEYLIPMLDRIVDNCGAVPRNATADAGYASETNIARAACRGVDLHVATGRTKHGESSEAMPLPPTERGTLRAQMREKLATPGGAKIYSRRKAIIEPVFGQIKNRGFRQFLLRGLEKVAGEWSLITLTHNLLKLHLATIAA
jgi:transposase